MKCITLKEFCIEYGFFPGNRGRNLSDFANIVGVSISYISKLYNARTTGSVNGPKWNKLSKYIEQYGYHLISANPNDYAQSNILKENDKLKKENSSLKKYIYILEQQLNDVQELVRISSRISENKDNLKELKVTCNLKRGDLNG